MYARMHRRAVHTPRLANRSVKTSVCRQFVGPNRESCRTTNATGRCERMDLNYLLYYLPTSANTSLLHSSLAHGALSQLAKFEDREIPPMSLILDFNIGISLTRRRIQWKNVNKVPTLFTLNANIY